MTCSFAYAWARCVLTVPGPQPARTDGESGLAGTTGAGQRRHAPGPQPVADLRELTGAADERRRLRRNPDQNTHAQQ
jgi:hypothetical protein